MGGRSSLGSMVALGAVAVMLMGSSSPLMRKAIRKDDLTAVKALVEAGEDATSALRFALQLGRLSIATELADRHGAEIDPPVGCGLFEAVTEPMRVETFRWLLERGADPNCTRQGHGATVLHHVAERKKPKHLEIARMLLAHGADPRTGGAAGWGTPIARAATFNNHDMVALFKQTAQELEAADKASVAKVEAQPAPAAAPRPAASPPSSRLPAIDEPLKTGARAETDAAVVVGIEDYFMLPDVPFASRDATAFYRFLLFTRGVPASRIRLLNKGASREAMLAAVEEVGNLGGPEGTVWVYFAGHGAASPSSGERLLLGDDARPDLHTFEARAIPVADLRERAAAGGARVAMILDTCYTGAGRDGGELIAGKRFAVPTYAVGDSGGVLEWTAASPGEWSGPLEGVRHGAFTYLVVGALRGWADGHISGQRDGEVTAEEAQVYVFDALQALQIGDQTPVLTGEGVGGWVLSSGASEVAPELDASALEP